MTTRKTGTGRWYPDIPPPPPGESDSQYTDRLVGGDEYGRHPYDHARGRQCSIGYHPECGRQRCSCPCRADTSVPYDASDDVVNIERAAAMLARPHYLPEQTTARRVMLIAVRAIASGQVSTVADLATLLGDAYDSEVSDDFAVDVSGMLGHLLSH